MKLTNVLSSGKKSMYCQILFLIVSVFGLRQTSFGQFVYPDDVHVIGDLEVGNSGTTGNISVTGDKGNSALPGLKVTGDGGVVFFGISGTGQIPATGSGTRMMWYPKKGAFRAGHVTGTNWDDSSIGLNSIAFNLSTLASGTNSSSFGSASRATSRNSFAIGNYTAANGDNSFAGGDASSAGGNVAFSFGFSSSAGGGNSIAIGWAAAAAGMQSVSLGTQSSASGHRATAFNQGTASGTNSLSFGQSSLASGFAATAVGSAAIASGDRAFAIGEKVTASAANSFVIGRNNRVEGDATTWVDTDPLFAIGNGTGVVSDPADVKNRNALTLLKNGKMTLFGASGTTPVIVLDPTTAQISVAGQTLVTPNSSGNVGIGVTIPSRKLEVGQNSSGAESILAKLTNNQQQAGSAASLEFGVFDRSARIKVIRTGDNEGNDMAFLVDDTAAGNNPTERMRIAESGNVGIGTAAPVATLHVNGKGAFGESITSSNSDRILNVVGAHAIVSVKRIHDSWGAGIEFKNRSTADGADNVSWMLANSVPGEGIVLTNRKPTDKNKLIVTGTSSNMFALGDNVDNSTLAGAALVVKLSTGQVGIGTTSPQAKLEVQGTVRFARQGDILMGEFGNPE